MSAVIEKKSKEASSPCFKNATKFKGIIPSIIALVRKGASKNPAKIIAAIK